MSPRVFSPLNMALKMAVCSMRVNSIDLLHFTIILLQIYVKCKYPMDIVVSCFSCVLELAHIIRFYLYIIRYLLPAGPLVRGNKDGIHQESFLLCPITGHLRSYSFKVDRVRAKMHALLAAFTHMGPAFDYSRGCH